MSRVLVLNGPNINLLPKREKGLYDSIYKPKSLQEINDDLYSLANDNNISLVSIQTNKEHELIENIQAAHNKFDFIIINAAAFTHTSIAIRDALIAVMIPFIEVHLSNIYAREDFRQKSYLSDIALGVISGFGPTSYVLALNAIIVKLKANQQEGN